MADMIKDEKMDRIQGGNLEEIPDFDLSQYLSEEEIEANREIVENTPSFPAKQQNGKLYR